jgi:hypothetical protein
LLRQVGEHIGEVCLNVPDPFPVRRDAEQLLGDDQAEQLDIGQDRLSTRVLISRKADRGQDPIVQMDIQCGQEGV